MNKVILILVLGVASLSVLGQQKEELSAGYWRGELERADGNNIVFSFEVKGSAGAPRLYLRNAEERLLVDDVTVAGDSVFIILPFFDSQFRALRIGDTLLKGVWIKRLADRNVVMPFVAKNMGSKGYRFQITSVRTAANISGRWATTFINPANNKESKAVGVFNQFGTTLTGSFITPYGDYRYLEGVVDGDSLKLSGFDGGYAIYFTAKVNDANTISGGKFYSGSGLVSRPWTATKDASAALEPDSPASMLNSGVSSKLNFTFNDTAGNPVSNTDVKFKNKVLVIQLLGSWCPNCMDETRFLNEIYDKYHMKGVAVLGLAYERTGDFSRSKQSVNNFMRRLNVKYPVLIPPVAATDPENAAKTLPQLKRIVAFPTTIFTDRQGNIQKVHSGFNGPGTGTDYEKQKKEYIDIIEALLEQG